MQVFRKSKSWILILKDFTFFDIFIEFKLEYSFIYIYVLKLRKINLKLINVNKYVRPWHEWHWRSEREENQNFGTWELHLSIMPYAPMQPLIKMMEDSRLKRDSCTPARLGRRAKIKKDWEPHFLTSLSSLSLKSSLLDIFTILSLSYNTFLPYPTLISYVHSLSIDWNLLFASQRKLWKALGGDLDFPPCSSPFFAIQRWLSSLKSFPCQDLENFLPKD